MTAPFEYQQANFEDRVAPPEAAAIFRPTPQSIEALQEIRGQDLNHFAKEVGDAAKDGPQNPECTVEATSDGVALLLTCSGCKKFCFDRVTAAVDDSVKDALLWQHEVADAKNTMLRGLPVVPQPAQVKEFLQTRKHLSAAMAKQLLRIRPRPSVE